MDWSGRFRDLALLEMPELSTAVVSPTGRMLLEARLLRGLSREGLAARARLSARTIYNIEHGVTEPRDLTKVAIARALVIETAEPFPNDVEPGEQNPGSTETSSAMRGRHGSQ
jgi:transcriptional regulator with XRE-family HTH domain